MRDMFARSDLARYAGQFVWLDLNFDSGNNRDFLDHYGAVGTPTFYVIDPHDGRVTATQTGAMSFAELLSFLKRGAAAVGAPRQSPADTALARGDALLARKPAEALAEYRKALQLAPPDWPRCPLAQASLVTALESKGDYSECAQTAAAYAAAMKRDPLFARTVIAGMWCLVSADHAAPWVKTHAAKLQPLAKEALALSTTVRDHRDELYRTLMMLALARADKPAAADWGNRWLAELDAIQPHSDEERTAVDIARVENIQVYGNPSRILPAMLASERAMPDSWNASLRVAQMENEANDYPATIAACDRGLARSPGPLGRSWLLQTKAGALQHTGHIAAALRALQQALQAAQDIPLDRTRDHNIERIKSAIAKLEQPSHSLAH